MVKKISQFSVIIRTKNEERWIGHAIQSLLDNLYKPEIIIIDNNSTDRTLDIIKCFIEAPLLEKTSENYTNIKILNIKNYTPGKSINLGVKKCTRKNVMILSAHCVLKEYNEKLLIDSLKKNVCVFGNQIPVWNGKKISKRYIWSHFGNKKKQNLYSKLENRYFLHNALAVYKKDILKKIPFNETLTGKEDRYWANKIIERKLNFLYDPSLLAEHHYTTNGNTWKGLG
jgi:rhamnosyltransferase